MALTLKEKIDNSSAKVGVIGLGYVGLPLAVELAKAGYDVTGYEVNARRCEEINQGHSYIADIHSDELTQVVNGSSKGKLHATTDFSLLAEMDTVSICVPTPLGKTRDPDVSYILEVKDQISKYIHTGMLIILESTTYPGTTDEIFVPIVENAGLKLGKDVFLVFSPERIDPGNKTYTLKNTPKVVGGMTFACGEMAKRLYSKIVDEVVLVSSARAAEMTKILENTFRAVNIGLVNEIAIMCKILDINTWEVIDAAATKPFGFTPFYPGPGLGGHCIPVDPHYLSWKLKQLNYQARFIDLAAEINTNMPNHVVNVATDILNKSQKSVNGSKILLLGMAYKPNVSDVRESPSLDIYKLFAKKGANITFHDPYVPTITIDNQTYHSKPLNGDSLKMQDLVIITTHHKDYNLTQIVECSKVIFDTRNATKGISSPKILRL
ncbi:MAG: nucleotide sugar dehydrogenase [Bdellovibrionales bacterium]|nr:nucleotide sugar dehydrogenase [Bdellovibrionales bacterium]